MKQTLHAEWTKLRTVKAPWWLLLATVVSTVAVSAATAAAAQCAPTDCHQDVVRLSLTGIKLGQTVVAVLAVLMISGEYSTGMMRTTLMATPRRSTVLAAKAVVLTGVVLVADPDRHRHRHLQQIAPMTAGLAVQATVGLDALPVGPWAGLGVLAGWAVAALLGGVLALRLRDA